MPPSTDYAAFRAVLRQSKHVVAIAGAGLSAASGIPTFRGAGGLWRSYDAISLATPDAFNENPSRVWQFYHMRREKARAAEPNAAHMALAVLAVPHFLRTNVDGLSRRALERTPGADEGTAPILEMHGRLFETICTSCGDRRMNMDSPICPALAGTEAIVERHEEEPDIPLDKLPRCQKCSGLLRPGVVWFGEIPLHLHEIQQIVGKADLGLIVGTSSTVRCGYAADIQKRGGKTAVFNLQESDGDHVTDFLFMGPCEETLSRGLFAYGERAETGMSKKM
ncbi:DHS-like NAD/FAD-binding domain-containing protein [Fomitopsis serialis]|uniref:DHS-like NAD/FAD-binding domain-containing protein n=1 Tax=Fomitopsis serialis TaxID=139415 RepID=UPI0020087E58|nr:DHS-like NAD/FAD-binding domain-containing protein [Neoantrodia serialis]KAH9922940.1 DHS-like NAD/FAD-binding domain-containing protein [Neoantrodia serialis]